MKIPDVQRSIAEGRLHESGRYETLFNRYFSKFVYVAIVIFIGIMPFWYGPDNYQLNPFKPYWLGISLIICLLIILRILSFVKLRRISGRNPEENRRLVRAISEEFNWPFTRDQKDYSILYIARTMTAWERHLVIIFDGNDLLVNFASYTTGRTQSLQGYFGEKRAFKKFERHFTKLLIHKKGATPAVAP
ncbi:MAG: hypothetical protein Roseis2KO_40840 [Roseivirga sp.]